MFKGEGIKMFYLQDVFLLPLYLIIILIFAYLYRNFVYSHSPLKKYFIPGMLVKIMGGLGVGFVYVFYYNGGDTTYYFRDSAVFNNSINDSFSTFFKLLFLPAKTVTPATYEYTYGLSYFRDPSTWMADRIYGVLSVLSFHSYPVMAMLISVLSFTGAWALLRTFVQLYPNLTRPLAFSVLFVPSVFFWGSGVLKDSITFGCLGWITYSSYTIFLRRKSIVMNGLVILFAGYIALQVKAYIIISFVPSLMMWVILTYRNQIKNKFIRVTIGPGVFLIALTFGYLMVVKLGNEFSKFSLGSVLDTAESFQQWHSHLAESEHASGYNLGITDNSWQSIVKTFPAAVNVTLFRPYLWEASNPVMLMAALESIFILGFTLYIFIRNGIRQTLGAIFTNADVFFCFSFSILFAFAVGFTSYNFGALVRYKIPCIPFFLTGLVILNYINEVRRNKLREEGKKRALRQYRFHRKEKQLLTPLPASPEMGPTL